MIYIFLIILCIASGIFFRMGGAEGYDKLWRRIGSSLCMIIPIPILYHTVEFHWFLFSIGLIVWGCTSYFGWVNYIVRLFADLEMEREYWWNFMCENICIQCAVLPYKNTPMNIMFAIGWGTLVAFIKVWIDDDKDGIIHVLWWKFRKDVWSEIMHGSLNAVGIIVNLHIG